MRFNLLFTYSFFFYNRAQKCCSYGVHFSMFYSFANTDQRIKLRRNLGVPIGVSHRIPP